MKKQMTPAAKPLMVFLAFAACFGVIVQFYFYLYGKTTSTPELVIRFFSFYTILTNGIITICCASLLLKPSSSWGRFFSKNTTLTSIAVSITIVGVVYNAILRSLYHPKGVEMVANELLHLAVPVGYILFWTLGVRKGGLNWNSLLLWMVYPVSYLIMVLLRGAASGYYPYPFLDVVKLGYPKVLLNSLGLAIAFILFALVFIAVDKSMDKRASRYDG
jgi:hypothetical protein